MSDKNASVIRVLGVCKQFGKKTVLDGFYADFPVGEVSCVMGESGCGKSTLLNIMMGFLAPDSGVLEGIPDRISAVFQEDRLCEDFSAATNVRITSKKNKTARDISDTLAALGLAENQQTPVRELSGGMKRRVAIARALLADGELLIMDEPFRGLDDATRRVAAAYVSGTLAGHTLIVVTHDAEDSELLGASRIIHMRAPK